VPWNRPERKPRTQVASGPDLTKPCSGQRGVSTAKSSKTNRKTTENFRHTASSFEHCFTDATTRGKGSAIQISRTFQRVHQISVVGIIHKYSHTNCHNELRAIYERPRSEMSTQTGNERNAAGALDAARQQARSETRAVPGLKHRSQTVLLKPSRSGWRTHSGKQKRAEQSQQAQAKPHASNNTTGAHCLRNCKLSNSQCCKQG
jgi:hypothetical protein